MKAVIINGTEYKYEAGRKNNLEIANISKICNNYKTKKKIYIYIKQNIKLVEGLNGNSRIKFWSKSSK